MANDAELKVTIIPMKYKTGYPKREVVIYITEDNYSIGQSFHSIELIEEGNIIPTLFKVQDLWDILLSNTIKDGVIE